MAENKRLEAEQKAIDTNTLTDRMSSLESSVVSLQGDVDKLEQTISGMEKVISKFNDTFGISTMEITAYAPLDDNAIEGFSYSGDPSVTASGESVEIGKTIAAKLPFGTKVWIDGFGWREVQDRGGGVGEGRIDIAVASRSRALDFGRQEKLVLYQK